MKRNQIFMALAFVLAIGGAIVTKANTKHFTVEGFITPGNCTSAGQVDCPGGSTICTTSGGATLYNSSSCLTELKKS